jgi:hypothetical protein
VPADACELRAAARYDGSIGAEHLGLYCCVVLVSFDDASLDGENTDVCRLLNPVSRLTVTAVSSFGSVAPLPNPA